MFLTELSPLMQELVQKPIAFMGGFVSGLLRLNLNDEPVSQWLANQGYDAQTPSAKTEPKNGKGGGPQSITIE
uniref:Uncharacterized protein n=1 Tax=Cyanothece sp. (strain PCC 7425 / ATCC 29141) TaxID=395961 RepID=B8HWR3_CYAP4